MLLLPCGRSCPIVGRLPRPRGGRVIVGMIEAISLIIEVLLEQPLAILFVLELPNHARVIFPTHHVPIGLGCHFRCRRDLPEPRVSPTGGRGDHHEVIVSPLHEGLHRVDSEGLVAMASKVVIQHSSGLHGYLIKGIQLRLLVALVFQQCALRFGRRVYFIRSLPIGGPHPSMRGGRN
jgi:hypothetical protein